MAWINLFGIFLLVTLLGNAAAQLTTSENQALQQVCGTKPGWSLPSGRRKRLPYSRKIYGGKPAFAQDAPWAVSIEMMDGSRCSGTLISPRHVITASHCVYSDFETRSIMLAQTHHTCEGAHQVFTGNVQYLQVLHPDMQTNLGGVSRIILFNMCGDYSTLGHMHDDVAILELAQNVQSYSDTLLPACIGTVQRYPAIGETVYVAAYGHTGYNIKHQGPKTRNSGFAFITKVYYDRWFETTYFNGYVTLRPGDSGSGAIIQDRGRKTVIGVSSSISNDGLKSYYYTVPLYYTEICRMTGICRT